MLYPNQRKTQNAAQRACCAFCSSARIKALCRSRAKAFVPEETGQKHAKADAKAEVIAPLVGWKSKCGLKICGLGGGSSCPYQGPFYHWYQIALGHVTFEYWKNLWANERNGMDCFKDCQPMNRSYGLFGFDSKPKKFVNMLASSR